MLSRQKGPAPTSSTAFAPLAFWLMACTKRATLAQSPSIARWLAERNRAVVVYALTRAQGLGRVSQAMLRCTHSQSAMRIDRAIQKTEGSEMQTARGRLHSAAVCAGISLVRYEGVQLLLERMGVAKERSSTSAVWELQHGVPRELFETSVKFALNQLLPRCVGVAGAV